ncbi:MAG: DUF1588 domain-containing protein [Planctomycetota bacterium]
MLQTRLPSILASSVLAAFACAALAPRCRADQPDAVPPLDQLVAQSANAFQQHCVDCHNETDREGGLDLTSVPSRDDGSDPFDTWVAIHDRVVAGEMPPDGGLPMQQRRKFSESLAETLSIIDRRRRNEGRAIWRRMNRTEYENTVRDLLSTPWLQIRTQLPADGQAHLFDKVGTALDTSHVQISRYLSAAESALREVTVKQVEPPESKAKRYYVRDQSSYAGRLRYSQFNRSPERAVFPLLDHEPDLEVLNDETAPATLAKDDPARREAEAFGVVAGSYEPLEVRFSEFEAPDSGRYKLRFNAYTFWAGPQEKKWWRPDRSVASRGRRGEPVSIYSRLPPRMLRKLASFDVGIEPAVHEIDVYLLEGESIQPDAARLFRSRPPAWHNPWAEKDGQPGLAMKWMEAEGPIHDSRPPAGHRLLFGDLPIEPRTDSPTGTIVRVLSDQPWADAARLLRRFMQRAYRRDLINGDVDRFMSIFDKAFQAEGQDFAEAMIITYSAVLCSPEFVSMREPQGSLDADAIASRLSYMLWNSPPDRELRDIASSKRGFTPDLLRRQVDRMLDDPRVERFVTAFCDYWLDLRNATATSPDERLYPDYYLDDLLIDSAVAETRLYVQDLFHRNLPIAAIVDSDHAFLNERLAIHYDLPAIQGVNLRRVDLPKDSVRGGLLTQAGVLKVTANGTTTSPVTRGAWVMERILGKKPPPPPASVPAIEPDTRGASTIRQQLAAHRDVESCAVCHQKIDPPGFALENFDVLGGWRDRYRVWPEADSTGQSESPATGSSLSGGLSETEVEIVLTSVSGFGKNGQPFRFKLGPTVDASGHTTGGRPFDDIRQFKTLLLSEQRQLARNLVSRLLVFATGAPIGFSDRQEIEEILDATMDAGYPARDLIKQIVISDIFLKK